MVIRKGVRHDRDIEAAQHREEALGVADTGHSMHALARERRQRRAAMPMQRHGVLRAQMHRPFAETGVLLFFAAQIHHPEIAAIAALRRFAHRPGRQRPAIAVTAAAVDYLDLDISRQPVMLQAVVADHDVAAGVDQRARRGHAVAIHPHRGAGATRDQHRLVAAQRGLGAGVDPPRDVGARAAVTAAGHARCPALGAQALDDGDGERSLAAAAGDQIADHQHGFARMPAAQHALAIQRRARGHRARVHARKQARGPRRRAAVEPVRRRLPACIAHGSSLIPARLRCPARGTASGEGAHTARPSPAIRHACPAPPAAPGPAPAPDRRVRWSTAGAR